MTPSQVQPQDTESEKTPETFESLAGRLDLELLNPVLSADDVLRGCELARENQLRAVVVRPCDVQMTRQWLAGSDVVLASVAGYPDGTSTTGTKLYEGRDLLRLGAREVEFVLNPAAMISRQFQQVETELMQISKSCHEDGARLTVVFNTGRLTEDLKIIATKICRRVEVDTIAIDGLDGELAFFTPLLKDVLRLKLARRAETPEQAISARDAGYVSVAVVNAEPILIAWRAMLAPKAPETTAS